VTAVPGKRAISDPDLRDRLYELLEHDHLPHSVGSRFVRLIVAIIVVDVLAAILASVPEYDARLHGLFMAIEAAAVVAFALEYAARIWSVVEGSVEEVVPYKQFFFEWKGGCLLGTYYNILGGPVRPISVAKEVLRSP